MKTELKTVVFITTAFIQDRVEMGEQAKPFVKLLSLACNHRVTKLYGKQLNDLVGTISKTGGSVRSFFAILLVEDRANS